MKWIKLWIDGWLDGSLRLELTHTQRAFWADLLALAGRSRFPGLITAGENFPFPHEVLARMLGYDVDFVNQTLDILVKQDRISKDGTGIKILNWDKYQSPQQREQKPYQDETGHRYQRKPYWQKKEKGPAPDWMFEGLSPEDRERTFGQGGSNADT